MKRPVVFLPGLLCDAQLWQPQLDGLAARGLPWVADLTRDDTMAAMARRVLAEAPFEKFALAGLSMGGYVALELMRSIKGLLDPRGTLNPGKVL